MSRGPYYVYIMQSVSRRALYIGMTNDLWHRVRQHKNHYFEEFSSQYRTTRLVYFEEYQWVEDAIARETQLKKWRREKKEWLIASKNPKWRDLSEDWTKPVKMLTPIA
jgi:putative endonuclease